MGKRIELHGLRDRRDHPPGQHPRHHRHDAREIRVALREVRRAVQVGLEEGDRVNIARLAREIGVRAVHSARLPHGKAFQRAGERGTPAPLGVQPRRAREFAHEHGVGRVAGIQRGGRDAVRSIPARKTRATGIAAQSLAARQDLARPLV